MGYTTDFKGLGFWTDRPLRQEHIDFLRMFNDTRHMSYLVSSIKPGPTRSRVETPVGMPEWHVLKDDMDAELGKSLHKKNAFGDRSLPTIDYNTPPRGVPGLWCGWTVDDKGHIAWDGAEKFYEYVAWLEFLISTYLKPWGYTLNGTIDYQGEDDEDFGRIIVVDNEVTNCFQWRGE